MIPGIVSLHIVTETKFRLRLWLPVFILWPFLLIMSILLFPLVLIADILLFICGTKIYLFKILGGLYSLFSAMHGTKIQITNKKDNSIVNITIL
jgi:hypothetical protein